MPRHLLNLTQAAERYGCSTRTLRTYLRRGIITGYRLPGGREIRIDVEELDRALIPIGYAPELDDAPAAASAEATR